MPSKKPANKCAPIVKQAVSLFGSHWKNTLFIRRAPEQADSLFYS